jgi:hypothetical protein
VGTNVKNGELLGTWVSWRLTFVSAYLALISNMVIGCAIRAEGSDDEARGPDANAPKCQPDVRNDEWGVDCSTACNHVMACRKATGDSDLATLTCGDCLGSCVAGVALGGNDLVESTEEDKTSWECAALVEGCSALDHNCDIF